MVPLPLPVPASVAQALTKCTADPRHLADYFCLADGPESIKLGKRELAHDAAVRAGARVYECNVWYRGAVFVLLFVVASDQEVLDRFSVYIVLDS